MLTDVTDGCKHTLWCPPEEQKERERERGRERASGPPEEGAAIFKTLLPFG